MKTFHKITVLALSLTASLILVGCGGGSSSSTNTSNAPATSTSTDTATTSTTAVGQAKLSVHLTDAPAEFEAVYVTIAEVHVHRAGTEDESSDNDDSAEKEESESDDGEWLVVATPNITYNLLELQNGITTFMGEELIPSGDYTQLRLILGSTPDAELNILGNPHPEAHYIILDDDQAYALKIPSNTVKYNHNFTLVDGGDVDMVIDFDAKKSIHSAGDKWLLKPVLKVKTELQ